MEKEKLLLIDTNSIIHRAFHALPPLKSKDGKPSGALYGSLLAFFKILSDFNPYYVAAAFDSPGKTFRHEAYKEYKAHRPKAPEDLISQIKRTQESFSEMGVAVLAMKGIEADDIVGSVSSSVPSNIETIIATGDLDILQLVKENVKVYTLKRGIKEGVLYDKIAVKERYEGNSPEKIADIKALQGDSSDNIPGVEGVGEKTAIKLIQEFGSIEGLYKFLEKNSFQGKELKIPQKMVEKLKKEKKKAFLSKELALIDKKRFPEIDVSRLAFQKDNQKVEKVLDELGFLTLKKRIFPKKEENLTKEKDDGKNLKFNF